ncbi:hypothetical protein C4794_26940, partial [Salmonella enterica subsp. enterica serovar Anatum]|uniref:PTS system mannose/fructose/sorbose family transporter subunit IID n=1 Tax=Salmonella enterica TaxID=28901 RepID=UPI000D57FF48
MESPIPASGPIRLVLTALIDDAQSHSQSESRITARDLRSVFWRSFTLQGSWNYERQQHMG